MTGLRAMKGRKPRLLLLRLKIRILFLRLRTFLMSLV